MLCLLRFTPEIVADIPCVFKLTTSGMSPLSFPKRIQLHTN